MRYQEYRPPIELASWIKLFWVFESRSNNPVPETIVADGFPELIIHFRSPFAERDPAGKLLEQPPAIACGQLTRPLVLRSSSDAGMIGIRFQSTMIRDFRQFTGKSPTSFLTDRTSFTQAVNQEQG